MSDEKFREAQSGLAMSQMLRDKLRPQPSMQQPMEEPMAEEPEMEEPEMETEEKDLETTIKDVVAPMFEELKSLITKKDEQPQEAVLKVEGTLEKNDDK